MRWADEHAHPASGSSASHFNRGRSGDCAYLSARKDSLCCSRLGHGTQRRGAAGRKWRAHQFSPHEPHPRSGSTQRARGRGAGGRQLGCYATRGFAWLLLRPRPFVTVGVHYWRESCGELGRRSLSEIRIHYYPRAGTRGGPSRCIDRPSRQPGAGPSGIRSAGNFCGIGRNAGNRDQSRTAHREEARGHSNPVGRFQYHHRSGRGGERNYWGGNAAGGHRDDGQSGHSGRRGLGARRLPELRGTAAGGTRRPGRGSRALDGAGGRDLYAMRGLGDSRRPIRRRARGRLERPQGRLCSRGAHLAELHCAGRRSSPHRAAQDSRRNRTYERCRRIACGQRLSCRRWQSASPGALRPAHPGPGGARHGAFHQYPAAVREVWRVDHRRARRGRRENDDDGGDVRGTRSGNNATRALRFRSRTPFESRQGVSSHAHVRGENRPVSTASSGSRRRSAVLLRAMGTHSSSHASIVRPSIAAVEAAWSDLRALVGAEHLRTSMLEDAVDDVLPQMVIEPGNPEEVAGALKIATGVGLQVIPRGGATQMGWGNPPRSGDLMLSTRRLNRVVEHAWGDMTATVEAGCTFQQLQQTLAEHGQRLALDPLWPDQATIGGILATNDSGPLRIRFGSLRDLIIGITLALPDGTLAKSGGKVVKNVAGYDLPKLATGSLGTLGIITQAIFRLHPLPRESRTLSFSISDSGISVGGSSKHGSMNALVLAIQDCNMVPTGVQVRAESSSAPEVDLHEIDLRFE